VRQIKCRFRHIMDGASDGRNGVWRGLAPRAWGLTPSGSFCRNLPTQELPVFPTRFSEPFLQTFWHSLAYICPRLSEVTCGGWGSRIRPGSALDLCLYLHSLFFCRPASTALLSSVQKNYPKAFNPIKVVSRQPACSEGVLSDRQAGRQQTVTYGLSFTICLEEK
jgi:hypothetical protein